MTLNAALNNYVVESLAPLVFRSGKPFGAIAGVQDVVFPLPSVAAGLVRALAIGQQRVGMEPIPFQKNRSPAEQQAVLQNEQYRQLLSIQSVGPFLLRIYDDGRPSQILVPKPANAIYIKPNEDSKAADDPQVVRLNPKAFTEECGSDLPAGLLPLQSSSDNKQKPYKGGAQFWLLEHVLRWQNNEALSFAEIDGVGLKSLPVELRTHVVMNNATLSHQAGGLFQTAGYDMGHQKVNLTENRNSHQAWQDYRYGFLIQSTVTLHTDLATMGGERRLAHFNAIDLPVLPEQDLPMILKNINAAKGFILTFLTPAIFANGFLPQTIEPQTLTGYLAGTSAKVQLKAMAGDRWLAVSGWDSVLWKPKAMRKAVNAGSVYWFALIGPLNEADLNTLMHMPLSDDEQDRRDGFGVALLTAWKNAE